LVCRVASCGRLRVSNRPTRSGLRTLSENDREHRGRNTVWRTNQFTLLGNCLNYLDNGQWTESLEVIEPFADGAIARHGPNTAIFSSDLNSQSVFDIQTSDGKRLRGGIRAIQLTDLASVTTTVLAAVKQSAPGELLPPDRIVYSNRNPI